MGFLNQPAVPLSVAGSEAADAPSGGQSLAAETPILLPPLAVAVSQSSLVNAPAGGQVVTGATFDDQTPADPILVSGSSAATSPPGSIDPFPDDTPEPPVTDSFLLLEGGDMILMEDDFELLLEA